MVEKKSFWSDGRNTFAVVFVVVIILAFGVNYFTGKAVQEPLEFEETTEVVQEPVSEEPEITGKTIAETKLTEETAEKTVEEPIAEITGEIIMETIIGSMIVTPSKVKAGEIITIKVGQPSGSKGYENKIKIYPVDKNLRVAEFGACRKSSYCYAGFEKEYKISHDFSPKEYKVQIYDRDLKDNVLGYFTVEE